ncbi:hypothetical protein BHE74_00014352, partial [Ensete ventricosum]
LEPGEDTARVIRVRFKLISGWDMGLRRDNDGESPRVPPALVTRVSPRLLAPPIELSTLVVSKEFAHPCALPSGSVEAKCGEEGRLGPAPMAPNLSPSTSTAFMCSSPQPRNLRSGQEERSVGVRKHPPERSASFHGRTATAFSQEHRQIRRPKTQPNLLPRGARSGRAAAAAAGTSPDEVERKVPTKVLVNVTVQRSLGPVQVMASTDWSVGDLVATALRLYVKEGRRPPLPTAEPSTFGLHYSQFSLESKQRSSPNTQLFHYSLRMSSDDVGDSHQVWIGRKSWLTWARETSSSASIPRPKQQLQQPHPRHLVLAPSKLRRLQRSASRG